MRQNDSCIYIFWLCGWNLTMQLMSEGGELALFLLVICRVPGAMLVILVLRVVVSFLL